MSLAPAQLSRFAVLLASLLVIAVATAMLVPWFSGSGSQAQPTGSTPAAQAGLPPEDGTVASAYAPLELTEQQQRGKQIYLTGISPTGAKLTAVLGNSNTEVPAVMLTCVNCHRHDGRGKPEGGIYPSNIRWDELTKPYGSSDARGRSRPPYDESLLKRAISMGFDSGGKLLADAMPRYRMAHQDLADLAAYLMVIGRELDPGLSTDRIRIGVILAPLQVLPEMNHAVRQVVSAYISEFNRGGGVYQREIELHFSEAPARREDRAAAAIDFVHRQQLFALTSTFIAGDEVEIARQLGMEGVPLVGAQTLYPQLGFPLNRHLFYLSSGILGQSLALVQYAHGAERQAGKRINAVLLVPEDDENSGERSDVANAIKAHSSRLGWRLQTHSIPAQEFPAEMLARNLKQQEVVSVLSLLSGPQTLRLLQAAEACDWFPACYFSSAFVGLELFDAPLGFDKQIFLAFPTMPSQQPVGMREYHRLSQSHDLSTVDLSTQFEALSAVKILLEGLKRAGSALSRERLVEELETLADYRTGFTPAVSFGPNRRVGAEGAYILAVDLNNRTVVPVSDWLDGSPLPLELRK
ncbi:MAG: ABC transporter substrate-binding protein [Planctomycetota bacterium]